MRLETYRVMCQLTYGGLADALGIPKTTAHYLCHGRPTDPESAARISKATGGKVSVAELLFPGGVPDGVSMSSDEADAAALNLPSEAEAAA